MRGWIIIAFLALSSSAFAQVPQGSTPQVQAMGQRIMQLEGELISSHTEVITLQRRVDELTKQISSQDKAK